MVQPCLQAVEKVQAARLQVQRVVAIIDPPEAGAEAFAQQGHQLLTVRDFGIEPPSE